jgi:hypothetical protein
MVKKVGTIAVDVALLLPPSVADEVRAINRRLYAQHPEGFLFDETHLPHITLLQLFVARSELPELYSRVGNLLVGHSPLTLKASGVIDAGIATHLVLARTPRLQELHEELMIDTADLKSPASTPAAFYGRPRDADIRWVQGFRGAAAFDRFQPHVTLGIATGSGEFLQSHSFTTNCLAVCQLGRFCTCRVILRKWTLGDTGHD